MDLLNCDCTIALLIIPALFYAACGFVAIVCLFMPGEIFDFVPKLWWKIFGVGPLSQKVGKALFQCEKCAAGQIALWLTFDIPTIILSIFFAAFIGKFYKSL